MEREVARRVSSRLAGKKITFVHDCFDDDDDDDDDEIKGSDDCSKTLEVTNAMTLIDKRYERAGRGRKGSKHLLPRQKRHTSCHKEEMNKQRRERGEVYVSQYIDKDIQQIHTNVSKLNVFPENVIIKDEDLLHVQPLLKVQDTHNSEKEVEFSKEEFDSGVDEISDIKQAIKIDTIAHNKPKAEPDVVNSKQHKIIVQDTKNCENEIRDCEEVFGNGGNEISGLKQTKEGDMMTRNKRFGMPRYKCLTKRKRYSQHRGSKKQELNKQKRERGEAYVSRQLDKDLQKYVWKQRPAKSLGDRCHCKTTYAQCCRITDEERQSIFSQVWSMTWTEKEAFVYSMVFKQKVKRRSRYSQSLVSKKNFSPVYQLKSGEEYIRVCKEMFILTTGLGCCFVNSHCRHEGDSEHFKTNSDVKSECIEEDNVDTDSVSLQSSNIKMKTPQMDDLCYHDNKTGIRQIQNNMLKIFDFPEDDDIENNNAHWYGLKNRNKEMDIFKEKIDYDKVELSELRQTKEENTMSLHENDNKDVLMSTKRFGMPRTKCLTKRKRCSQRQTVSQEQELNNKQKRERGEAYVGRQLDKDLRKYVWVQRPARYLGDRCHCKTTYAQCSRITDEERQSIFSQVWSMTWTEKEAFVYSVVFKQKVKRRSRYSQALVCKNNFSSVYQLKSGEDYVRVCKEMFILTTGLGYCFVDSHCRHAIDSEHFTSNSDVKSECIEEDNADTECVSLQSSNTKEETHQMDGVCNHDDKTGIRHIHSNISKFIGYPENDNNIGNNDAQRFEMNGQDFNNSEKEMEIVKEEVEISRFKQAKKGDTIALNEKNHEGVLMRTKHFGKTRSNSLTKRMKKQELNKQKRERGEAYVSRQLDKDLQKYVWKQRPAKLLGDRCRCKTNYKRCNRITDEERQSIFSQVWYMTWTEKEAFVYSMVKRQKVKRRSRYSQALVSKKNFSSVYQLKSGEEYIRVCKEMFISTTGLSHYFVESHSRPELDNAIGDLGFEIREDVKYDAIDSFTFSNVDETTAAPVSTLSIQTNHLDSNSDNTPKRLLCPERETMKTGEIRHQGQSCDNETLNHCVDVVPVEKEVSVDVDAKTDLAKMEVVGAGVIVSSNEKLTWAGAKENHFEEREERTLNQIRRWKQNGGKNNNRYANKKYCREKPTKMMGDPCQCKANYTKCKTITDKHRQHVFSKVWSLTWSERKGFVSMMVQRKNVERRYTINGEVSNRRNFTLIYHLLINDEFVRVCKKMFTSTTGLGENFIESHSRNSTRIVLGGNGKLSAADYNVTSLVDIRASNSVSTNNDTDTLEDCSKEMGQSDPGIVEVSGNINGLFQGNAVDKCFGIEDKFNQNQLATEVTTPQDFSKEMYQSDITVVSGQNNLLCPGNEVNKCFGTQDKVNQNQLATAIVNKTPSNCQGMVEQREAGHEQGVKDIDTFDQTISFDNGDVERETQMGSGGDNFEEMKGKKSLHYRDGGLEGMKVNESLYCLDGEQASIIGCRCFCKARFTRCWDISDNERETIFSNIKFMSMLERAKFVKSMVVRKDVRSVKGKIERGWEFRRNRSGVYCLKIKDKCVRVCKKMFIFTTGLEPNFILTHARLEEDDNGTESDNNDRSTVGNENIKSSEVEHLGLGNRGVKIYQFENDNVCPTRATDSVPVSTSCVDDFDMDVSTEINSGECSDNDSIGIRVENVFSLAGLLQAWSEVVPEHVNYVQNQMDHVQNKTAFEERSPFIPCDKRDESVNGRDDHFCQEHLESHHVTNQTLNARDEEGSSIFLQEEALDLSVGKDKIVRGEGSVKARIGQVQPCLFYGSETGWNLQQEVSIKKEWMDKDEEMLRPKNIEEDVIMWYEVENGDDNNDDIGKGCVENIQCVKSENWQRKKKSLRKGNGQREINKRKREKGESYIGKRYDQTSCAFVPEEKQARFLGGRCRCKACYVHCKDVTEADREAIFSKVWSMTWPERERFVSSTVFKRGAISRSVNRFIVKQRLYTFHYHFDINGVRLRVCKTMYLSTTCLSDYFTSKYCWTGTLSRASWSRGKNNNNSLRMKSTHNCQNESVKEYINSDVYGNGYNKQEWTETNRNDEQQGERCQCDNFDIKCKSLTDEEKKDIFSKVWSMSWAKRKSFVWSSVFKKSPVEGGHAAGSLSLQNVSSLYHLKIADRNIHVCEIMFLSTTGLSAHFVNRYARNELELKDGMKCLGQESNLPCLRKDLSEPKQSPVIFHPDFLNENRYDPENDVRRTLPLTKVVSDISVEKNNEDESCVNDLDMTCTVELIDDKETTHCREMSKKRNFEGNCITTLF